jgi:hypothetical protein
MEYMKTRYTCVWLMIVMSVVVVDVVAMNENQKSIVLLQNSEKKLPYKHLEKILNMPIAEVKIFYDKLHERGRHCLRQQINACNNERLLLIFDISTLLPDIRSVIANTLGGLRSQLRDYFNGTAMQAYFYPCFLAYVRDNQQYPANNSVNCSQVYNKEEEIYRNLLLGNSCCIYQKKDDLVAINKFKSVLIGTRIDTMFYQYRKSYTLDNFKEQFDPSQFAGLPLLLAPYIIDSLIPSAWTKYVDEKTVAENIIINANNNERIKEISLLKANDMMNGAAILSRKIRPAQEPIGWWPNRFFIAKSLAYGLMVPIAICIDEGKERICRDYKRHEVSFVVEFGLMGFFTGIIFCSLGLVLPYFGLSKEQPLMSMACITTAYVSGISLYNVIQMRNLQSQWCNFNVNEKTKLCDFSELDKLLKRTDIDIE